MKTNVFLTTVFAALTLSLTSAMANSPEKSKADVQLTEKNNIVMRYLSPQSNKANFMVYNDKGDRVSARKVSKTNHAKLNYDLSHFAPGTYMFTVKTSNGVVCAEKVTIDANGAASIPVSVMDNAKDNSLNELLLTIK